MRLIRVAAARPLRLARSLGTLLTALLLTTCSDNPTGPGRAGLATLRVAPGFDAYAQVAPLVLDNVRVIVVRPPADTVAVASRSVSAGTDQLQLAVAIPLRASSEDLQVSLELYGGPILLFSGSSTVRVVAGSPGAPQTVPVTYQGPGAQATAITVGPRDTTLSFGAIFPFRASATDAQGQPVAQFYVSWSLPGAPAGATLDATGSFTAPSARDTLFVKAVTPSGLADSTRVFIAAPPATLVKTGGDNQSAPVGTALPQLLAVEVTGSDGLPVPGVVVSFAAATGGGAVDSAQATTDAQGIARSGAILGPTVGAQTFTAAASNLTPVTFSATALGILPPPILLAAGGDHSCRIATGGQVLCWGSNGSGQLGDGTTTDRAVATPVTGGQSFASLSAGVTHTCGLTAAGQAFCWGDNSTGALGDGTTTSHPVPTPVSGGQTFVQLAAGGGFTCGLTATGQALCWGGNSNGALGDGTQTPHSLPAQVSGTHTFAALSAGTAHVCAIEAGTGAAWCWGLNLNGELGDGSTTDRLVPTAVIGGVSFGAVAAASRSSCGLDQGGAAYCWGYNFGANVTTPTASGGSLTFVSIDMGGDHVCALTSTGQAYCAGTNTSGQLGDGSTTDQPAPVAVLGGLTWTAIAGGGAHTCGTTATDTRCWGAGASGQLGDGTATDHLTPAVVRGPAASVAASAGDNQTGAPGTALPVDLTVLVQDGLGAALPGVQVSFAVTAGGGSLSQTSVLTNGSGLAATTLTLGSAPGTNTVAATVASAGVSGSPVTFTETAGSAGIVVWTGAADGNWSNAGNWNPALVPGSGDSVVVGTGPNLPSLTAPTSIAALTIAAGGSVTLNAQTLNVARTLATTGTGILVMTDPADLVQVGGNAVFDGGTELNFLSAGTLVIAGNLTQAATNSSDSYHPSNAHITRFTGQNPTITFATPGLLPGSSHFEAVEWTGSGTLTLGSDVMAHGTLSAGASGITGTITSAGHGLTLGGLNSVASVFNNTTLTIEAAAAVPVALANVTFQGLPTSATQLTVDGPGAPTAGTVSNFTFMPLTTGNTGFYVRANDTDGANPDVLTFTVTNDPGNGLAFTDQVGVAIVNWGGAPVIAWTGAVSTDWNTAGNWNPAVVPTPTSFVTIAPATNQPLIGTGVVVQDLTVQANATLTVDGSVGGVLATTGNLTVNGTLSGPAGQVSAGGNVNAPLGSSIQLAALLATGNLSVQGSYNVATTTFAGTGQTVPILPYSDVLINGSALLPAASTVTLSGNMVIVGQLDFNGGTLVTGGAFQTTGTGTITMTQAGELLQVGGAAAFAGGSTAGLLTDGQTDFRGDFAQAGDPQAFAPSGNHITRLSVIGAHSVFFTNPSPTESHFNQLDVSGAGGAISLGSDIEITGSLTSTPGGGAPALDGSGNLAHIRAAGANITALDLTNATLALDGGPITSLSGINFQGYPDTATALTVRHPGQAAAFVPSNLTFGVVPTTGFYLRADDSNPSDGLTLTLNLVGASPVSGAPYIQEVNGAVVNWPPAPTWTGALSTDWFTAGNWSTNTVPTAGESVVIAAATFQPVLTGPVSVGAVNLTSGTLSLNGQTLTAAGNFVTSGSGVLISTTAGSQLVVGGDASFGGGDETGQLSAGTLSVAGNFSQAAGTGGNNTFVATGTHRTILNGTGPQTLTLATSSASESRFFDLVVQNTGGAVTIPSLLVEVSDTLFIPGAGTLTGGGSVSAGAVNTAASSDLSVFQLTASGNRLVVGGAYGVNQTILVGGPTVPALSYANLILTGTPAHSLTANIATSGFLTVQGGLTLNGHTASVGGNFQTATGGVLTMTNAADQLTALGNVTFDGGSETGLLTAGLLEVGGDFSQLATTSTTSFVAGGSHLTRLINADKLVSMASGTATFNDLEINMAGTATVSGQIQVARDLTVTSGGTLTGNTVVVGRNVTVVAGSFLTVSFLEFSGALSNAGQFSPGTVVFANPAGGTIPASGGGISYGTVIVGPSGGGLAFSLGGPASMTGSLTLNSEFIPGGNAVSVGGNFTTSGTAGVLTMTNALDQVTVTGFSYFGGGDETGHLTAGTFTSSGRLTQDGTNSPASFVASGTHSVVLATFYSGGNGIDFSDPATSHFQDLHILDLAPITTDLVVNGNLEVNFTQANNLFAKHLTVGGTLTQNGIGVFAPTRLTLQGDLTRSGGTFAPDTTEFTGTVPQTVTDNVGSASYGIALVQNDVTMSQGLLAASDLTVSGTLAFLHLTPSSNIDLSGKLQVLNQGRLEQTDPGEKITVAGDVTFDGGDETGLLTAGQMVLSGNFTQLATTSISSFAASGTHQVLFQNASPTISFADPVNSGFQELEIVSGGTVTLGSAVQVKGILDGNNAGFNGAYTGTIKAAAGPLGLTATWLWSGNTVLDGVTLSLIDANGSQGTLTNITFQNLPTTATQLSLSHPGAAGFTYTMTGINFMPLGVNDTGLYLDLTDYDDASPVLQVSVSHDPDPAGGPTAGAFHTQTDGIAATPTWLP